MTNKTNIYLAVISGVLGRFTNPIYSIESSAKLDLSAKSTFSSNPRFLSVSPLFT